jgi:hypothetical protein
MLSRRQFVTSTLAAGVAPASQIAIAQPAKRTIVDAQVHLWKAESEDWKWVPGMKPQMPEPFMIEKLVPLMDQAGVDRVVIVPPSWPELSFLSEEDKDWVMGKSILERLSWA